MDAAVLGFLATLLVGLGTVAQEWRAPLQPMPVVSLEMRHLPLYTLFSLTRGVLAYAVSFAFTMVYGYAMARVPGADRLMLPVLDILQSIPVLGFLPGLVLGLVHLFPNRNAGLELASVLMIFTGQVWNMTFSFYASLKSVPPDLLAVARLTRMSWWERFVRLDLSYSAHGLLWNSMMSMAGGWFFLMVSEAFVLGEHDFRLPGLGSYMSLAMERGDGWAQLAGVLAMLGMIVCVDQVIWRPLVSWSHKFTDEETHAAPESWLWERIRRSRLWNSGARSVGWLRWRIRPAFVPATRGPILRPSPRVAGIGRGVLYLFGGVLGVGIAVGVWKYLLLLSTLHSADWFALLNAAGATLLRVGLSVLMASVWALPVGVWIGRHPRWVRLLQPVIQMAASFPAPMIFPVVVAVLLTLGIGIGVSSVVLLMLGTQWYILFNVIAGSSGIPRELWEVARLCRFSWRQRWQKLILPAVFPSLLTGWITAMGGAWNASIVAEFVTVRGKTLVATGLGASISQATEHGNFHVLAAAVGIMAALVVLLNRLIWHPLSRRAQTRFSLES